MKNPIQMNVQQFAVQVVRPDQSTRNLRDKENHNPATKPGLQIGQAATRDKPVPGRQLAAKKSQKPAEEVSAKTGRDLPAASDRDVQFVEGFIGQILAYIREHEVPAADQDDYRPLPGGLDRQKELNEKMREILVDWMQEVCLKHKFGPQTFFLAVNLVDRFLASDQVTKEKFQLLGVTSLFIAAKYEEIYPPNIRDFLAACDNSFAKAEVISLECKILALVDYRLAVPSAFTFTERFSREAALCRKEHFFALFLIDLSLTASALHRHKPSAVAAAAVYLANKVFRRPEWPEKLQAETGLGLDAVRKCAKDLFLLLFKPEDAHTSAIRRKYALPEFYEVSKLRFELRLPLEQPACNRQ